MAFEQHGRVTTRPAPQPTYAEPTVPNLGALPAEQVEAARRRSPSGASSPRLVPSSHIAADAWPGHAAIAAQLAGMQPPSPEGRFVRRGGQAGIVRPTMNDHTYDVVDNKDARRYELMIDGASAGFLEYQLVDGTMVLPYVEIDPAFGGRGNGGRLTAAVLDDCRARGLKVVPECPFIKAYLRAHPEYADLRAD